VALSAPLLKIRPWGIKFKLTDRIRIIVTSHVVFRSLPALTLLVLLTLVPAACQPSASKKDGPPLPPQAMEHFRQGHKLLGEQKLDEALKEFQEIVRLAPGSPQAHYWLGKVHFLKQEKNQAEKAFQKVLELDPKNYQALTMLGRIYAADRDRLDQARQYLEQALAASPDNPDAHFELGRIYAVKGMPERALLEFRLTLAREGDFALYHFEIGRVQEAWGNHSQALLHYNRALVLNPRFTQAEQALQRLEQAQAKEAPKPQKPTQSAMTPQKKN
jgi:tetratricopeptide (TPR) repeat protein